MRPIPLRSASRRRGVALLLAMIAVIVSSIVAYSYLAGQGTAMGIARNIRDHARARYIAETGLDLTLAAIQADSDWRTTRSHGVWATSAPLAGGSVTIIGQDGQDQNADGIISVPAEGDASLSDDTADAFTLIVIGNASGATHVLRLVGTPLSGAAEKAGYTSPLPTPAKSVANKQIASKIVVSGEGTLTSISLYGDGPPPKEFRLAVYSDAGGEPAVLLAQTAAAPIQSNSPGWSTLALSSPLEVTAGAYWLAFAYEHSNMNYYYTASGNQTRFRNHDAVSNGFTATWGSSDASDTRQISIYATISGTGYTLDWR